MPKPKVGTISIPAARSFQFRSCFGKVIFPQPSSNFVTEPRVSSRSSRKAAGKTSYDKKPMFDRATDEHHIANLKFVKQGPFHMQEDLARHIRKCFGKDIVIGLQVDMNGNFVSLHALRNGRYSFRLPRKCKVVNMKTGKTVKNGTLLELDMTAGETRWYRLLD